MFGKKRDKSKILQDILDYKNVLEEVRFSPEVEHDEELMRYFDEAIDKAERNESILTINSKLNYQLTTYIQTHHFKAPKPVSKFMTFSKGDITSGMTSIPVTWNTIH
ncbi:bacteriocin immunity protein [Lactobacillus sp. LL6]|uniref:bacteriocin immunity protein n=1 Tax=Lactobacillus sp. LL6 TaxID=2596827 RepID=UPI00118615DC|nr:bacteriocin immunity protein [Lactobacillus sp. LL6]TSO25871.1 bacteriocin immunity protein [Lactobacillus sp. LL6]